MTEGISIESGSEVSSTLYHTEDTDRKQQEVLEPKQETTPLGSSIEKMKGDEALLKASSPHLRIQETKTEKPTPFTQAHIHKTLKAVLESNNPDQIIENTTKFLPYLIYLYKIIGHDLKELAESSLPQSYGEAMDWLNQEKMPGLKDQICICMGMYLCAQTELAQSVRSIALSQTLSINEINPILRTYSNIETQLSSEIALIFRDKIDLAYIKRFRHLIQLVRERRTAYALANRVRMKPGPSNYYSPMLGVAAQELGKILVRLQSSPGAIKPLLEQFLEQFFAEKYLNAHILQEFLHTPIFPLIAMYDDLSNYRKAFELACSELTSWERESKWALVHLQGAEMFWIKLHLIERGYLAASRQDQSLFNMKKKGLVLIESAEKLIGQRFYYPTLNIRKWSQSWSKAQYELNRMKNLYSKLL